MPRKTKLLQTGEKFNKLTVVKLDHIIKNKFNQNIEYYLCKCDCGVEKVISKQPLISIKNKNCYCKKPDTKPREILKLEKNNINPETGEEYTKTRPFREIVIEKYGNQCQYCGRKNLNNIQHHKRSLTIDHIIPKKLLKKCKVENLLISCQECNSLKGDYSLEEFRRIFFKSKIPYFSKEQIKWLKIKFPSITIELLKELSIKKNEYFYFERKMNMNYFNKQNLELIKNK